MKSIDHAELEQLIDNHGVSTLLDVIADIAGEKAEHVRSNWNDETLAECWDRVNELIQICSQECSVIDPLCQKGIK